MRGIADFWGPSALPNDREARLWAMTPALAHRGPDAAGLWYDESTGLSISELSEQGKQPMLSADRRWVVSCNGEIHRSNAEHALRPILVFQAWLDAGAPH
jgi:asparagine synthase (glutamine-hydrolysing)